MLVAERLAAPFGVAPGLDLRVAAGAFVGVVGPNGAGKSTLLRLLAGVLRPTGGAVMLKGRPLADRPRRAVARVMALVPQEGGLADDFTVAEAVALGRHPHRSRFGAWRAEDADAVAQALAAADLEALRDRPVQALSGGERQRVLFARALAQAPEIMLLDEPTAHLDLAHRQRLLDLLAARHRAGLTVICVLHDLNLAALYCDRLVLMAGGRIVADGAPAAVLTADALATHYGAAVDVVPHPTHGAPQILARRGGGR